MQKLAASIDLKIPSVAVCLAAYNGIDYIDEQIQSILLQQGVDLKIFISVDQSTDGTEAFLAEWALSEPRITLLPFGQRFGGASKNFFRLIRDVDFSAYDYFSFADQDDIWFKDKLVRAVTKMVETNSDGYSSNVIAFWPSGKQKLIEKSQSQTEWDYLFEAAGPGCTYVMTAALASEIKKSVVFNWSEINKLGLHDWYSYAYARANNFKWFIDDRPSMLYRQHLSNQVGVNKGWKAFLYRLKKVASGWGIEQSALVAKLIGNGDTTFVNSWNHFEQFGLLKLAFSANKCRRKPQDKFLFFFACLLMAIVGKR